MRRSRGESKGGEEELGGKVSTEGVRKEGKDQVSSSDDERDFLLRSGHHWPLSQRNGGVRANGRRIKGNRWGKRGFIRKMANPRERNARKKMGKKFLVFVRRRGGGGGG